MLIPILMPSGVLESNGVLPILLYTYTHAILTRVLVSNGVPPILLEFSILILILTRILESNGVPPILIYFYILTLSLY
jgi:hypothetical protein